MSRFADLTLSADGTVTGTARLVLTGQEALHWRQLTLRNDDDEVKKRFNEMMKEQVPDGVQADFDHFLALDDYNSNLMALIKITGTLGSATGKHVFLPAQFFQSHAKHPFVAEDTRTIPVDVKYAKLEQDDVTYHLPEGYTLDSALQGGDFSWPNHSVLKIAATSGPAGLDVTRKLAYNFTLLEPKDYASLHDFYQKVATADQQQIVLTRSPAAAKSN